MNNFVFCIGIILFMKEIVYIFLTLFVFLGCSREPKVLFNELPQTHLTRSEYSELPNFEDENYEEVFNSFLNNCKSVKTQKIYQTLCLEARDAKNMKEFTRKNFIPYEIDSRDPLLTGYYEPELHGSFSKSSRYKYPIYNTPKDLVTVSLGALYSELGDYRLRGRLEGNKLVPYYSRLELSGQSVDAEAICYCDSKIDLFFLEVQGSGRVKMDNNETIFIGYDNQNGHPYKSIGKRLVQLEEISQEDISLQSLREWFRFNPDRVDEVLNHNSSVVFFKRRERAASGSLGLELTPLRSVAVDPRYVPLGSMLYLSAETNKVDFKRVVFAQDTGGAIKGSERADMFLGFGDEAGEIAGELKAPLKLWIFMPKSMKEREN